MVFLSRRCRHRPKSLAVLLPLPPPLATRPKGQVVGERHQDNAGEDIADRHRDNVAEEEMKIRRAAVEGGEWACWFGWVREGGMKGGREERGGSGGR